MRLFTWIKQRCKKSREEKANRLAELLRLEAQEETQRAKYLQILAEAHAQSKRQFVKDQEEREQQNSRHLPWTSFLSTSGKIVAKF